MLSTGRRGSNSKQYKVVLVGDAGVGKSFLIQRLKTQFEQWQVSRDYKPTAGSHASHFKGRNNCHLYILETSGLAEYRELTKIYLNFLDCVIFMFALNDPHSLQSLKGWHQLFLDKFSGDGGEVAKYVLGTKMDTQHDTKLQTQAAEFAHSVGAELAIASAITGTNVSDFFEKVAESLSHRDPIVTVNDTDSGYDFADSADMITCVDDELLPDELLMSYPDPLLIDTKDNEIMSLRVQYQAVTMTTADKTLIWGCSTNNKCSGPALRDVTSNAEPTITRNLLITCIRALAPVNSWQHEWLECSGGLATTVRRQPTEIRIARNVRDIKFCSRDMLAKERAHGLYYMLLQTPDSRLMESGHQPTSTDTSITDPPKPLSIPGNPQIASYSLSCTHAAIATDVGKAMTWGYSPQGALGIEEHEASHVTTFPVSISVELDVSQVACGVDFTLFLCRDGTVYSCGCGSLGNLGHGDTKNKFTPTKIEGLSKIKAIAAGDYHSCAIMTTGWLYAWGLPGGAKHHTKFITKPEVVKGVDNARVLSMACGSYHMLILTGSYRWLGNLSSGVAYSWGLGTVGALGHSDFESISRPRCINHLYYKLAKTVQRVAAGRNHSAFLTNDGAVYTCGSNEFGQLGYFTEAGCTSVPSEVDLGKTASGSKRSAKEVTCTEDCTMVLTDDDAVLVWGKFSYGRNLPDPFPVHDNDVTIIDVTTCSFWEGPQGKRSTSCDVILGLTGDSRVLVCGCIGSGRDYQVTPWLDKALTPCSTTGLTRIASVGPMLVAIDEQGKAHYANITRKSWLKLVLGMYDDTKGSLAHSIISSIGKLDVGCSPKIEFHPLVLPGAVVQVETTLSTFVFRTDIGDLFSWEPFSGGPVQQHHELDDQIIVQIACGAHHVAALTDTGGLLTCGTGLYGQLGHGDMRKTNVFEMVPLCKVEKLASVSCGIVSMAVQAVSGKVYFWGQLDLPKYERKHYKEALRDVIDNYKELNPRLSSDSAQHHGPASFKLDFVGGCQGQQLAIVGKAFEFKICSREVGKISEDLKPIFRVEAKSIHGGDNIRVKGRVTSAFTASIQFLYQNLYKVSVTLDDRHVLGSPFNVQVEKGVPLRTCKVTLIGCDTESLKSVAFTLRDACAENQNVLGSLCFAGSPLRVELWGNPPVDADQKTANMAALASLSDGGVFVYVWDGGFCDFPRENLKFWLHHLHVKASLAHVIVLGVNIGAEHAHGVDLKPFRAINPNLRKAILVGSYLNEPGALVREIKLVAEERLATEVEPIIWSRLETLEARVREKREQRLEIMERREFIRLANECGIEGETYYKDAANHLEKVGLALLVGGEDIFVMFDQHWISRQLTEVATSCHRGLLTSKSLDKQKTCLTELLIRKNLGFHTADGTKLYLIPCFSSQPDNVWQHDDSKYTVSRHLLIDRPPYHVFTAFPIMAANLARDHHDVTFGTFACVIHGDTVKSRIDAGPCLTNNRKSEIRIVVQSDAQATCEEIASLTLLSLKGYIGVSFPEYLDGAVDCVPCNKCLQHYFDLASVEKAASGNTDFRCEACKEKVMVTEIMSGYKRSKTLPHLGEEELLIGGTPGSPPVRGNMSPRQMLRPIIQQLVEHSSKQEKRLMNEMTRQFQNMTKVFMDLKDYDCPRTICLLPDFQSKTPLSLKGDILSTLKRFLLLRGQKKFRLHLLCEGHGDGTGVHFLDASRHTGYEINNVNELLIKCVGHFRTVTQLLIQIAPTLALLSGVSAQLGLVGLAVPSFFPSVETIDGILGIAGLSVAALQQVKWDKYFKEVDNFLKDFQSTTAAITQPKHLGRKFAEEVGYHLSGRDYKHLQNLLHDLGKRDEFGGLVQEPRDGIGMVWVCENHRRYGNRTEQISIQQHHF